jgi:two-component system, NarL family, sensor kinase
LNPPVLSERGLQPALGELCDHFEEQMREIGCELSCRLSVKYRYSHHIEQLTYRFILECLNNVYKHSHACHVRVVVVDSTRHGILCRVEDDGDGFDVSALQKFDKSKPHLGLPARVEQVYWAGGTVDMESRRGRTRIQCDLPPKRR